MLPTKMKPNLSSNTNKENQKSVNKNKTNNNGKSNKKKKKMIVERNKQKRKFDKKQKRRQPDICKYFISGSCKNDDCPFSHDVTADQMRRFNEPCKYYAIGECAKGDMCCFMHQDFPCTFFHRKSGNRCLKGDTCLFSHDPLTQETSLALAKYLEFQSKRGQSVVQPESVIQQPIQPDFGKSTIFTKNAEDSLESSNIMMGINDLLVVDKFALTSLKEYDKNKEIVINLQPLNMDKYRDEECSKNDLKIDENKNKISTLKHISQSSFSNSLVVDYRQVSESEDNLSEYSHSLSPQEKETLKESSVKISDNHNDTDEECVNYNLQIDENKNNLNTLKHNPQSSFSNSLFMNHGQDSETVDILLQSIHSSAQKQKDKLNENSTEILKNKNPSILETLASNLKNIPTFTKIYDSDSESELRICDLDDKIISKVDDHEKGGRIDKPSIISSSNSMDKSTQEAPFVRNFRLNDQNIDPIIPSNNVETVLETSDYIQTFFPVNPPENHQLKFENKQTNDKEINLQNEQIENEDKVIDHENIQSSFEKRNLNNKGKQTKKIKSQPFNKSADQNSSIVEQSLKNALGNKKRKRITIDRNNPSYRKLQKSFKFLSSLRDNRRRESFEKETVTSDIKGASENGKWEFFNEPFSFDENNFMEERSMCEILESLNLTMETSFLNDALSHQNTISSPVNISCDLNNMDIGREKIEPINSNVNTQMTDSSQILVSQNPVNMDGNKVSLSSCFQVSSMTPHQSDLNKITQSVWPPPLLILPPAQSYHEMNIKCYNLHHKFDDPRIENHPQALKPHWSDWILSL